MSSIPAAATTLPAAVAASASVRTPAAAAETSAAAASPATVVELSAEAQSVLDTLPFFAEDDVVAADSEASEARVGPAERTAKESQSKSFNLRAAEEEKQKAAQLDNLRLRAADEQTAKQARAKDPLVGLTDRVGDRLSDEASRKDSQLGGAKLRAEEQQKSAFGRLNTDEQELKASFKAGDISADQYKVRADEQEKKKAHQTERFADDGPVDSRLDNTEARLKAQEKEVQSEGAGQLEAGTVRITDRLKKSEAAAKVHVKERESALVTRGIDEESRKKVQESRIKK